MQLRRKYGYTLWGMISYDNWSRRQYNARQANAEQYNTNFRPADNWVWNGSLDFLGLPYSSAQHSNILFWNFAWICKPAFAASMAGVLCSVSDDAGEIDQYQGVPGRLILCVTALVLRRERHQCSCVVSELQTFGDRQSANTQRDFAAAAPLFDSTKKHKGQENEGGHDRPLAPGCC